MSLSKRFFAMNALALLVSVALTGLVFALGIAAYANWYKPLVEPASFDRGSAVYLYVGAGAVLFFIVIFLAMNFWLSVRVTRGVIRPVSRLREAAARISEGDVSSEIAEDGEGEVRELCRALERLRIKLKESVALQQKYDENRKFLMSSISHDLKTPVTSIKGHIEGILDGVAATPEKLREYLETARSKSDLMNAMIDDLLLYSRLDLHQLPYHYERTELLPYLEDCVHDHAYEFAQAGIGLTMVNETAEPVTVRMDREKMGRVLQNILDNARKYAGCADGQAECGWAEGPADGSDDGRAVVSAPQVDVILRETRTSAIVEIRDNGKGIAEADLPYIFERFYRADPARRSAEGSGLGLAIAKQIVEDQEGKIWVRSKPGEGTRIMISLKKF
ncbi:MAG: two-component system sensor histidine kinase [Paenibacillaceae bacterium]|jgi:signal transduction histidine kinase|nr:two-component system sensor histidine kinase [Paenibacillaceae bacterium]